MRFRRRGKRHCLCIVAPLPLFHCPLFHCFLGQRHCLCLARLRRLLRGRSASALRGPPSPAQLPPSLTALTHRHSSLPHSPPSLTGTAHSPASGGFGTLPQAGAVEAAGRSRSLQVKPARPRTAAAAKALRFPLPSPQRRLRATSPCGPAALPSLQAFTRGPAARSLSQSTAVSSRKAPPFPSLKGAAFLRRRSCRSTGWRGRAGPSRFGAPPRKRPLSSPRKTAPSLVRRSTRKGRFPLP